MALPAPQAQASARTASLPALAAPGDTVFAFVTGALDETSVVAYRLVLE